jgi:hypothetical protein
MTAEEAQGLAGATKMPAEWKPTGLFADTQIE